jgi:hypothetical protein
MEALPFKTINDRKVYHIKGVAQSTSMFSMFYRINDIVESFIDYEGFFSHRFQLKIDETKQTRNVLSLSDSLQGKNFFWSRWNHKVRGYSEVKDYFPMQPYSQDSLSALMWIRTVPLPDGAEVRVPVIQDGKNWDAIAKVVRREKIKTPMGVIPAIVLQPEMQYQGAFRKSGENFLWLSDDDRRFILRLEAKVKIGTVVISLKKLEKGTPPTK